MPRALGEPRPTPQAANVVIGPDGYKRTREQEAQINSAVLHTFATDAGRACLKYLRDITVEAVIDPSQSDGALRHQEGMRHLVKLIETRIAANTRS